MLMTIQTIVAGIWLVTTINDCFRHKWDKITVLYKDFMILLLIADIIYLTFKYIV